MIEAEKGTAPTLVNILKEVCAIDEVSLDDSFLDLGGDSLSAMLCVVRIRETFGVDISLEDFFFDDSTVEGLASLIDVTKAAL
jgi:acyl carrier protein